MQVVYKCTVSATLNFPEQVYLAVAEGDWKQRFYNHKNSIKSESYRNDTPFQAIYGALERNTTFFQR